MKYLSLLVLQILVALPSVVAADSRSPSDLADSYVSAYRAGNMAGIESLVYWEGVPLEEQPRLKTSLRAALGEEIERVELVDVSPDLKGEFQSGGVRREFNLKPIKKLVVTFKRSSQFGLASTNYVLGEHNGETYIAVKVPKK